MDPKDCHYSREHEWIRMEGRQGTVGITRFAQDQLGDVVFVELPDVGRELRQGEIFGVVESVKTVSDLYSPLSGKVVRRNDKLLDNPELVNTDPYGEGWMIVIEVGDGHEQELGALLDADQYRSHTQG